MHGILRPFWYRKQTKNITYVLKGELRPEISLLHMKVLTLIKAKGDVFLWYVQYCSCTRRSKIKILTTRAQNKYSTRSPTPCRRLWCWCPRIFGRRHLPSKRAWEVFTLYWRCWCRFYEEKQFVVNFGTWTINQNALWQIKSPQTKSRKTKTAC